MHSTLLHIDLCTQVDGSGLGIRSYTTVFRHKTCDRITIVYVRDRIRRNTETVSDRIFPIYGRKWAYTGKPRYADHEFLPYWNHKPFYQTGSISDSTSVNTPSIRSNSSIKTNGSKRKKLNSINLKKYSLFVELLTRNDLKSINLKKYSLFVELLTRNDLKSIKKLKYLLFLDTIHRDDLK
jgi:hypothetical protein